MKKIILLSICSVILLCLSYGCAERTEVPETMVTTPATSPETTPTPLPSEIVETPSPMSTDEFFSDIYDLELSDLDGMLFTFSSGAGAWLTGITMEADGSFSGYHSDQDMGDTDDEYPNGTRYYCAFRGKFTELTKIGDYEYSMKCAELTQEGTEGEVMIGEDGVRYITSTPYGFDDADMFSLFLPGKSVEELPETFLHWTLWRGFTSEDAETLPFYGLYNIAGEQGFC